MNITVKNGSSIWQLATLWGDENVPSNFCNLFWCVLWRLFFISVGCICAGAYLGFLSASVAASFAVGHIIWSTPIVFAVGLALLISGIFLIAFLHHKTERSMEHNPTGFISNTANAYSAWKDKYCPKVTESS